MKRLSIAAFSVVALLMGLLAGPAAAQDIEGFQTDAQCAVSIAAFYEVNEPEFWEDEFAGLEGAALTQSVSDFLALNGLEFDDLCAIYASGDLPPIETEVEEEVEEDPEDPEEPAEEPEVEDEAEEVVTPVRADPPTQQPVEVLGEVLSRTGADTTVLLISALAMFGLGFLALRRTRPTADEA